MDWSAHQSTVPKFIGRRVFKNFDLTELAKYIDWHRSSRPGTWQARSPPSSRTRSWAPRRPAVFSDGQRMLERLIGRRMAHCQAPFVALYPANTVNDDDIEFYTDESRTEVAMTWYGPAPANREAGN